jgi:hypothetical protein
VIKRMQVEPSEAPAKAEPEAGAASQPGG